MISTSVVDASRQVCRACGADKPQELFVITGSQVLQCLDCGHTYLDITHTAESIREMYRSYQSEASEVYFEGIDDVAFSNFDDYLRRCRSLLGTTPRQPRLLDVGCGSGAFLGRAQQQGFVCEGAEICEPLAHVVRRNLGCDVHMRVLSELDFPEGRFDVVTMYDVVEHLQDPIQDLRKVNSWLKPGGILFLLTPNDGALIRKVAILAYRASLHRLWRPMRALYYSHHLSYFTNASLNTLASKAGFEVAHMETRNQEMSRLSLSTTERVAVRMLFAISALTPSRRGKLVAWMRKI